jgi:hypothetical protein
MVLSNAQWFNKTDAYTIDQSCRFNDGDSAYLYRDGDTATPSSDQDCTISAWVKRGSNLGSNSTICNAGDPSGSTSESLRFGTGNQLQFSQASSAYDLKTTALYRDVAGWYHVVAVLDLNNSTQGDRVKLYVNGERITDFATETYPSNTTTTTNFTAGSADVEHVVGSNSHSGPASQFFDGYIAEVACLDGQVLEASSFGETNSATGQWIPKSISGLTFGTNGYYLDFADSSALGNDVSGNDNDFTPTNLAAADQMTDSPTNNFSTMSPLGADGGTPTADWTFSDGNLVCTKGTAGSWDGCFSTFDIPKTGKWAFKWTWNSGTYATATVQKYGATDGTTTNQISWEFYTGQLRQDSTVTSVSISTGDNAEYLVDMDNGTCKIYKNGSLEATFTSLTTSTLNQFGLWAYGANAFTVEFDYTPSDTDYETLCTANLPDPTIADPSAYFQPTIYTGNGSTQSIDQGGNSQFSPDFVWIKNRDAADNHCWFDTVRGATELISSNNTDAESTDADTLTAFDSDGFSLGDDDKVNTNTEKYVGWQWLEDTTSAFDMVTYTGTGSTRTVAHNLGVKPDLMIFKRRNGTQNWQVYHSAITAYYKLFLDLTLAKVDDTDSFNDTEPTASVFTVKSDGTVNAADDTYIAYLFAGVDGFSKFGKYEGNGSTDGPFLWFGFRPAYFLFKRTDSADNWRVYDNQRGPFNEDDARLEPNGSGAEASGDGEGVDFLSNGLKFRSSDGGWNADGGEYVFAAFAETPFKTANAR